MVCFSDGGSCWLKDTAGNRWGSPHGTFITMTIPCHVINLQHAYWESLAFNLFSRFGSMCLIIPIILRFSPLAGWSWISVITIALLGLQNKHLYSSVCYNKIHTTLRQNINPKQGTNSANLRYLTVAEQDKCQTASCIGTKCWHGR